MRLHLSKCHIVGNHMSRLIWLLLFQSSEVGALLQEQEKEERLIAAICAGKFLAWATDYFFSFCAFQFWIQDFPNCQELKEP